MDTSIQRDDAGFVDEFLKDHDVPSTLKDLVVTAVPASDTVPPARDAPCPPAQIFISVG